MVRTFIYGSCVSRDTFVHIDKERFSLIRYVARSGLVSAFAPPTPVLPDGAESLSPFQRRQLEDDFQSSLPRIIENDGESIDLLLWDLIDERLGLYVGPHGQVVSDSLELRKLGKNPLSPEWRHVRFGSNEHFEMFCATLPSWRAALESQNLHTKALLLAPPWASHTLEGAPSPTSFGVTADEANASYRRYYDEVRERMHIPILGRDMAVATDREHIWGAAPFHYTASVYRSLVSQIQINATNP